MSRGAKIGLVVAVVFAGAILPPVASAAVLYDQTASAGLTKTESMSYPPPSDVEAADDFTVPTGQVWNITQVDVVGGASDPKNLLTYVRIYASVGTLPGGLLFQQNGIAATNGPDYNSSLANVPALGPGTYWISVAAPAFWGWRNSAVQVGSPAAWQNPSGEYGPSAGCGKTWTTRTTCFPASTAEPDQAFRLIGAQAAVAQPKPSNLFSFGAFKRNVKKGVGTLTVKVPGAGAIALSGKGLKAVKAVAAAAGDVKLKLKAKGKAGKKLNAKGKATVKAIVTFTPTGGDSATKSKTVTLKKKH